MNQTNKEAMLNIEDLLTMKNCEAYENMYSKNDTRYHNLELDTSSARQTKKFLWDSTLVHRIKIYWSLTKQYEVDNYKEG